VLLVRELLSPHLIAELPLQDLQVLSSLLGAHLVVAAGVEEGRTAHRLHQLHLSSAVEILNVERGVDRGNRSDIVIVRRHPEGSPGAPTVARSQECLRTLALDVGRQFLVFGLDCGYLLLLDYL
jgi:hypothetical protein